MSKQSSVLALVRPLKGSLADKQSYFLSAKREIQQLIRDRYVEALESCSDDPSFVLYVCQLVENIREKYTGKLKITGDEKKQLAVSIITELLPSLNNEADIKRIGKLVDFLCLCALIVKVSGSTQVKSLLKKSCSFF